MNTKETVPFRGAECREVYEGCLADIKGIEALFDDRARCLDKQLARERMSNLKSSWKNVIKEFKGTEAGMVVQEALCRIRVKTNSTPDVKWIDAMYSARIDLEFYLEQAPIGRG